MISDSDTCPCRSGKRFGECCGPFLSGAALPPTAEALMRSRYTAFATHNVDYLEATLLPGTRDDFDREAALEWATSSLWTGLDVRYTEAGGAEDDAGVVEFVAHFQIDNQNRVHHETATFIKQDGRWWYVDGIMGARPRKVEKIGRNDSCPCGSGKKYKKCCGLAA